MRICIWGSSVIHGEPSYPEEQAAGLPLNKYSNVLNFWTVKLSLCLQKRQLCEQKQTIILSCHNCPQRVPGLEQSPTAVLPERSVGLWEHCARTLWPRDVVCAFLVFFWVLRSTWTPPVFLRVFIYHYSLRKATCWVVCSDVLMLCKPTWLLGEHFYGPWCPIWWLNHSDQVPTSNFLNFLKYSKLFSNSWRYAGEVLLSTSQECQGYDDGITPPVRLRNEMLLLKCYVTVFLWRQHTRLLSPEWGLKTDQRKECTSGWFGEPMGFFLLGLLTGTWMRSYKEHGQL